MQITAEPSDVCDVYMATIKKQNLIQCVGMSQNPLYLDLEYVQ